MREIRDRFGNALVIERDSVGNLTQITSPSGRYVQFIYNASDRITQANDNLGRTLSYGYDIDGRLIKATDPAGKFEAYTYDANHNMLTVQDKRGKLMVTNVYDVNSRVSQQTYHSYDALERLVSTTYANGSTVGTSYDTANRPTQFADSASGTVTLA